MAVELDLIEQFLLTIFPTEVKADFIQALKDYRNNPPFLLANSINATQTYFRCDDQQVRWGSVNGVICGMLMCDISNRPNGKEMFEGWLEAYARHNGENVVDFLQQKAKRK